MPVPNLHHETPDNSGEFADMNMVHSSLCALNLHFLDYGRAACETCRIVSDRSLVNRSVEITPSIECGHTAGVSKRIGS
jgi:hypothetical protein